jgi:hypothetical protein
MRILYRFFTRLRRIASGTIPEKTGARLLPPEFHVPVAGFCSALIILLVLFPSLVYLPFQHTGFPDAHPVGSAIRSTTVGATEFVPGTSVNPAQGEESPDRALRAVPTAEAVPDRTGSAGIILTPFHTGPSERLYPFVLHGDRLSAHYTLYDGVYAELESRFIRFDGNYTRYYHAFLDDPLEETTMHEIVAGVQSAANEPDDQLRCAVSLVQAIPYGRSGTEPPHRYHNAQYPYETLYENSGVCEDKSLLLAAILRKLGYGVALFKFDTENHMAVGVRCADGYDFRDTGYAFIETTVPCIATDDQGKYVSFGRITTMPEVIPIAEGKSFGTVEHEFRDAREWNAILAQGHVLDARTYARWKELAEEYGILAMETG